MEIKFKSLHMHRGYNGEINGSITIGSDDDSEVKVRLPGEALEPLVEIVAEQLAEATSLQVARLKDAILNRQNKRI